MTLNFDIKNIKDQFQKILETDYIMYPLAAFGVFKVLCKLYKAASGTYKHILQPHLDFVSLYQGEQSWVVITGGSDGIGFGFAEYFGNLKFNIVLIARSKSKLEEKQKVLEQKFGIQVKIISADFNTRNVQFFDYIKFQLKDLDIAILINNVGGYQRLNFFHQSSAEEIEYVMNINTYSNVFMTASLLPQLLQRDQKSAIINLGSGAATTAVVGRAMYSGSKAFVAQFSNIFQQDLKYKSDNKIDVLCFAPNFIHTKLQPLETYVQVPGAINGTLKSLGRRVWTKGHWLHSFQEEFMTQCPLRYIVHEKLNKISKEKIEKNKQKQKNDLNF